MRQAVAYQLSAPSLDGCTSCGQGITNCQCIKFDKAAQQDGMKIADELLHDPIKHFFHYAAPAQADNLNAIPTQGEIATNQSHNGTLGMPTDSAAAATASNGGPSF